MGPGFSEQETKQLLDSMEPITVSAGEDYAPPAPAPEKLTEKQIRQLRRMWITKVNGTVKACEHKDNFTKTDKREGKQPNIPLVDSASFKKAARESEGGEQNILPF